MNGQRDEWGIWDATPQFVKKKWGGGVGYMRWMHFILESLQMSEYSRWDCGVNLISRYPSELLKKPHIFILEPKNPLLLRLWFFFYLRDMFAVCEIPSSLKAQLCSECNQSQIAVWEAARKGRVSSALPSMYTGQRGICRAAEMNVREVSAGKQRYSPGTLAMRTHRG